MVCLVVYMELVDSYWIWETLDCSVLCTTSVPSINGFGAVGMKQKNTHYSPSLTKNFSQIFQL